ncbi:hypothetical protein MTR67_043286 [Solanum verrucosum]|uniref:Uncharacterized protein n=1 Tax=Solanum verrucosum TaxID=315347 RepID=A0AAF0URP1_SOLVR|nr:hypothetical protein MTR67_043286 [Solanum verrucosum]
MIWQVNHLFTVWGFMTLDSMSSSHGLCRLIAYSHHMEMLNGKFTFDDLNLVL